MNAQTDSQLLRAYAESRSEAAFAELVRRHVDFAYSAALRMVRDEHLAEDVTQGVFLALAKNAAQLQERPVLSGWLHRTAQNIAAQTVRTIERRRAREQEAAAMNELFATESDGLWEHIAPHLDAALGALSEADRDALLLRYFERKSAQEMAQVLGVSDEAAQKRVSRAVERLRKFFAKRGVTVGTSGLVVVISANAVQAAPVGLAATISTAAALGGTTIAATATATVTKAIVMTATQKVLIAAIVFAAAGAGIYEARQASTFRTEVQNLQQQQSQLAAQNEQLTRERDDALRQAAAPRDAAQSPRSVSLPPEQMTELLRLRGEVGRLRTQEREIERLRREQMQVAETKVPHAQAEFDRLTKLHAEKLVSAHEVGQARFAVELLKAEAKGNITGAAQIRVQQAEAELEHVSELYQQKLVDEAEYNKAKYAVDIGDSHEIFTLVRVPCSVFVVVILLEARASSIGQLYRR